MFSVVLDACVLYPAYLRDTLLRMAAVEMYRPLWTGTILDELLANLPRPWPQLHDKGCGTPWSKASPTPR